MITELDANSFKAGVQGSLVVVDFWAPWCGPCKIMDPVLEKLATKYEGQIKFTKLNVDNNQAIAKEYSVYGLPTIVLFRNGKGVEKVTGIYTEEKLAHYLDRKLTE
ncbi:thioredoxin [Fructilactobacillus vespulae]|uniref:thioredoxin n=1 Tax=Fructilactobacillus vespulae TaxID=1249630 RepID=UPI0039B42672